MEQWYALDTIATSEIGILPVVRFQDHHFFFIETLFEWDHTMRGCRGILVFFDVCFDNYDVLGCLYPKASLFHYSCVSFGPPEVRFRGAFFLECGDGISAFYTPFVVAAGRGGELRYNLAEPFNP